MDDKGGMKPEPIPFDSIVYECSKHESVLSHTKTLITAQRRTLMCLFGLLVLLSGASSPGGCITMLE